MFLCREQQLWLIYTRSVSTWVTSALTSPRCRRRASCRTSGATWGTSWTSCSSASTCCSYPATPWSSSPCGASGSARPELGIKWCHFIQGQNKKVSIITHSIMFCVLIICLYFTHLTFGLKHSLNKIFNTIKQIFKYIYYIHIYILNSLTSCSYSQGLNNPPVEDRAVMKQTIQSSLSSSDEFLCKQ